MAHLDIYANARQYSTCSDAACWCMFSLIACGRRGRRAQARWCRRAHPRRAGCQRPGGGRRATPPANRPRGTRALSLATPSNAGPSRPGALQAPLTAYYSPLHLRGQSATAAGVRTQGSPVQRYSH